MNLTVSVKHDMLKPDRKSEYINKGAHYGRIYFSNQSGVNFNEGCGL